MLYSDTGKDGKQSRETSPPEVSPKGRGSKVVLSWYGSLSFYRSTFFESLLIRKSPVVPASRHRFGVSQLERRGCSRRHAELPSQVPARERHPASALQESILLSQEPVSVHFVIGCHRPGSQAFDPSFPALHPIPAFLFRFCPDTPSASLLSVVSHTSHFFLPYTVPVPRFRFHSRFCSRPDTCLHSVPAPVALPTPARIYPSPRAPDPLTSATCFRPLPSMAGPKSVGNGNSKAMAAAQGRGHVVQSIRAADRYLSSGE